jgi:hypothetical protein
MDAMEVLGFDWIIILNSLLYIFMILIIIKKLKLFLFFLILIAVSPALASANGFSADADVTVRAVTFGNSTVDMTILNGSTTGSLAYDSGTLTVTDPVSFKVSCGDSSVYGIRATLSRSVVACVKNSEPGTSYLTLPSDSGEYTIEPIATNLSYAVTYNSACGAATCESGYAVSDSGANAVCVIPSGGAPSYQPTSCSTVLYDDWQTTCVNGWQYRNVKSQSPSGCSFTSSQENDRKRQCGTSTAPATETTPITSFIPTAPAETASGSRGNITLGQMTNDAIIITTGDVSQLMTEIGIRRDLAAEAEYSQTIVEKIVKDIGTASQVRNTINNFVTYGTKTTIVLGAGERAGVVNSFKFAFGELPTTEEDWNDVIKIANGRWPGQISKTAEDRATINFRKVYLRNPDRTNPHDDAAITVMAYGLRPANRNLDSEKKAIGFFKNIYGYNPVTARAWGVVRAIAYSGATR